MEGNGTTSAPHKITGMSGDNKPGLFICHCAAPFSCRIVKLGWMAGGQAWTDRSVEIVSQMANGNATTQAHGRRLTVAAIAASPRAGQNSDRNISTSLLP